MKALPRQQQLQSDRNRYIVYVLWLHGSTQSAIARVIGLSKGQVAGIITRSDYCNRSILTTSQRSKFLEELLAIRRGDGGELMDGGILPVAVFKPRGIQ